MEIRLARQHWPSVALLVSLFAYGIASGTAEASQSRRHVGRSSASAKVTSRLYETQGGSVVGYPLNADGLPATAPDWQLSGGLREATAVALDGAGYMYVSDAGLNQVRVYAPGASGTDLPVRIIPLAGPGCTMAVNKAGYVFATYAIRDLGCSNIFIYAPGAGSLNGSSVPQPLHRLSEVPGSTQDVIVDDLGRLFVADLGGPIVGYTNPLNQWQFPDIILTNVPKEYIIFTPIAAVKGADDLYFQTALVLRGPWGGGDHGRRSLTSMVRPDKLSLTRECNGGGLAGLEYSLAVNRNYLMFTCRSSSGLFVYRNRPGRQRLVEALPGGIGLILWP